MKPAIVVVAYNRAHSLERLLQYINAAIYYEQDIPLIISIDKGENQDVLNVANDFVWDHGIKEVVYQSENLKLRRHIIKCGDLSKKYGSVIILEDDLVVSKYFYEYAKKALEFSADKKYIAGVSLYNHRWNVNASEPFEIIDDQYDNWYIQFACSWGEAWTCEQWGSFKDWYQINETKDLHDDNMPEFVAAWQNSSWLKYFIKYIIEENLYYIYPKKSLTTNFSDAGTHVSTDNTNYQVPLQCCEIKYNFSDLKDSMCVYDAYFENRRLVSYLEQDDVTVDLYGTKQACKTHYLITRKILGKKIVKRYACSMRPHESNIINEVPGQDFFLYDMTIDSDNNFKYDKKRKIIYNHRHIRLREFSSICSIMVDVITSGVKKRIKRYAK